MCRCDMTVSDHPSISGTPVVPRYASQPAWCSSMAWGFPQFGGSVACLHQGIDALLRLGDADQMNARPHQI